jgi:rhodanese-related sulfurtransferase
VILDVRSEQEYFMGRIPGAINIDVEEIEDRAEAELTDKDQLILVYCRSGNRSKTASGALAEMGYTNVKEFGGINDWPYMQTR